MDNRQALGATKGGNRLGRAVANYWARQAQDIKSRAVARWHALLCGIAALNIVVWSLSAIAVTHVHSMSPGGFSAWSQAQLLLSAAYVVGCAFRSVLPVYDIPRVVLVDSRLSSVLVGRSVATIAELCFAAQWALLLHHMAVLSDSLPGRMLSQAIVPLIVLAELCSWYAVLTTAQRAHALENSLWAVSAMVVIACLLVMEPHRVAGLSVPIITWCVGGAAYVAYIFLFDVPAYWSRWRADQANGRHYLSIASGLIDASQRRVVCYRWEVWKSEVPWMTLYFAFGVWTSVSLVYASLTLRP
ncbi:MAG TPA: hypothetical protein VGV09_00270 [Steroidobacteraceae bacterium]|nr:hypothetical protein [Steroidobacteraceae bacterium]